MKQITKDTVKHFVTFQGRYKKSTIAMFVFFFIGIMSLNVLSPLIYKEIFDLVASNPADKTAAMEQIMVYIFLAITLMFIGNISIRITEYVNNYSQGSIMRDLENDTFRTLHQHSYNFFASSFTGSLVSKIKRFVSAYERIADRIFWDLYPIMIRIVFMSIVLFFFSPILALLLVVWVIFYVTMTVLLYKWKYKYDIISASQDSIVTGALADAITNVSNIKTFSKSEFENKKFAGVEYRRYEARKKSWDIATHINVIQGFAMGIFEIVLIYLSLSLWAQGTISIGVIIMVQVYFLGLTSVMWNLGRISRDFYESFADAEEMIEILKKEREIKDPVRPEPCVMNKGEIEIRDVTYRYEGKTKIFQDFNFKIKAGESIGLVGESGSGKSTITKLLLRFVDVESGAIYIDKQDIRNVTQEDLRNRIAYVPQDPILFHRSLKENIAYSRPDAPMEDIIAAAKKAKIHDFIMTLPEGYETYVGERGIKLSGGERQRVAIARAFLKDAPILILDEATSSLDSESEIHIQQSMKILMKGRTSIIIAHRLSTIRMMDRIVVLDKGKIVEEGTHNKLLKKKGKYAKLWSHQSGGFI